MKKTARHDAVLDEPPAEHRADRGHDGGESGPGADRPPAFFVVEGRRDDCQAARHEEGRADALNGAAAMSVSDVGANPQSTDAIVKTITPDRNTRRRPSWSPSDPPTRISEPRKSAYASMTH
jgi:hypothetical protein